MFFSFFEKLHDERNNDVEVGDGGVVVADEVDADDNDLG